VYIARSCQNCSNVLVAYFNDLEISCWYVVCVVCSLCSFLSVSLFGAVVCVCLFVVYMFVFCGSRCLNEVNEWMNEKANCQTEVQRDVTFRDLVRKIRGAINVFLLSWVADIRPTLLVQVVQCKWTSLLDLLRVGPKFTRPTCRAAAAGIGRYLLRAPDLSSKPAGCRCCCRSTGQTDGRTDTRPFYDAYGVLCRPRNK